jgi:ribosomal subunit interface protein
MKIQIRARDLEMTEALRSHVERRLGLALGRFGERIERVAVHLSNAEQSPDGSKENRCRIVVGLPRRVKVQETDADVLAAVDRATDRAARKVARVLDRERAWEEQQSRPLVESYSKRNKN